jgi:hypothetical protein
MNQNNMNQNNLKNLEDRVKRLEEKCQEILEIQKKHLEVTKTGAILDKEKIEVDKRHLYLTGKNIEALQELLEKYESLFNLIQKLTKAFIILLLIGLAGPTIIKILLKMWISLSENWQIAIFTVVVGFILGSIVSPIIQTKLMKKKKD